jgi:hypothetical protein
MSEAFKICPICRSQNHRNATVCATCGTTLSDAELIKTQPRISGMRVEYDYRHGETDLAEGNLFQTNRGYLIGGILALALVLGGVLMAALGPSFFQSNANSLNPATTLSPTTRPTLSLATVTLGPPTDTRTPTATFTEIPTTSPTPSPCIQRVNPGDDLITLAFNCGHRHLDVIPLILELNDLSDAALIQADQELIIPWPTPTLDPNLTPSNIPAGEGESSSSAFIIAQNAATETPFDPFAPPPTKTLQPGVMWHQVRFGENIISIALQYGANVEILSQLNPEVTFSQCDFGMDSGGGTCVVNLFEGQLLRVPAPTPTPTLSPTPSGSETATPTITPTYNVPNALSPSNRSLFLRDELVTLRWVATGTLAPGQSYRVMVENITTGQVFTGETRELYFIVPTEWQGTEDTRYEYRWSVGVIDPAAPATPLHETPPLLFIWQGRGN